MDRASFQRFYERSAPQLRSYLRYACRNTALADDLLQETYLRLLKTDLPDLDEAQLRRYLYRTAQSALVDHLRKAGRETATDRLEDEAACAAPELPHDIQRVLEQLRPRDRQLLWLAYVEGFSHREMAPIIGVAEKSIRVLLLRARERMAALLEDQGLGPGDMT